MICNVCEKHYNYDNLYYPENLCPTCLRNARLAHPSVGLGWEQLVTELNSKLSELYPDYRIEQIKEKFGGLRYYVSGVGEDGLKLIWGTEDKSYTICEKCGDEGKLRTKRVWLLTLCDSCVSKDIPINDLAKAAELKSYDTALPKEWVDDFLEKTGYYPYGFVWNYPDSSIWGEPFPLTNGAIKLLQRYQEKTK